MQLAVHTQSVRTHKLVIITRHLLITAQNTVQICLHSFTLWCRMWCTVWCS